MNRSAILLAVCVLAVGAIIAQGTPETIQAGMPMVSPLEITLSAPAMPAMIIDYSV